MKPILEISNISKKFRIHHERHRYLSLRDKISSLFKSSDKASDEDFWALRDISFHVDSGESIGIIGKNGAGKSTLLKILSRITPPTSGKVISRGRIASLLEVGTGFHAELSGKENVFLNGSILGMRRKEIQLKFDEIVDFSGVENFIDTPLKHYSSGMQLRLAFAVAAFLEPEILIVDEVLAVGDLEFQKKCMGKMEEIRHRQGRTILFVSHNLEAIEALCNRGVILEKGRLKSSSDMHSIVKEYKQTIKDTGHEVIADTGVLKWNGILNRDSLKAINPADDLSIDLSFAALDKNLTKIHFDVALTNENDNSMLHGRSVIFTNGISFSKHEEFVLNYTFQSPNLAPGHYFLTIYVYDQHEVLLYMNKIEACTVRLPRFAGMNEEQVHTLKSLVIPPFSVSLQKHDQP